MKSVRNGRRSVAPQIVEFSSLEGRTLFCAGHGLAGGPIPTPAQPGEVRGTLSSGSTASGLAIADIPVLNSKPGARANLYLDFAGEAAQTWVSFNVTDTPAYNGTFADVNEIWSRVAEKFSPFNLNVTTVDPGAVASGKTMKIVVGGDGEWSGFLCGGLSYVGSFVSNLPNTAFVFSENLGGGFAKYVAEAVSHEAGHAFGLEHQSSFDTGSATLAKLQEYSDNGGSSTAAPTMGNSYSANRGLWWKGISSDGAVQDDIATLASSLNGFGYRADDVGNGPATAKGVKLRSGKFTASGVINSTGDKDYFAFSVAAGAVTLKVRPAAYGGMLDATLSLYRADGRFLARANTSALGENLMRTLPAGRYVAVVTSHGRYGEVGQYTLYGYGKAPTTTTSTAVRSASAGLSKLFSNQPIRSSLASQLVA